jgi:glycerophosphoryl diester phosphodiesterase
VNPWPYPRVIAHRGGGALAPENTLAGLRTAKALGFGAVEFDVMLAGDGVPVLMHDETLERTTNGRGAVAATPYAALAALDAGSRFGPKFRDEPVPSFAAAAKLCVELGLWANVEIKPARGQARDTGRVAAKLCADAWRANGSAPLLSSFEPEALEAARAAAPQLSRGFLSDRVPADWRAQLERHGCVSLHCDHRHLTEGQARSVRDAGFGLACYTVNDAGTARRLFGWGVDAIFTDRLDRIGPDFFHTAAR